MVSWADLYKNLKMPLPWAEGGKSDVQLSAQSGIDCNVISANQRGPGIMGCPGGYCLDGGTYEYRIVLTRGVAALRWL